MLQVLTAKIRVYSNEQQAQTLYASMDAFRNACNYLSGQVYESKDLSQSHLNKLFYYQIRETFGLPSQMTQSVIRHVIATYKSMKSNHNWECAKFKRGFTELVWNRDYLLRGDVFSVNSLSGRLKLPYSSKGFEAYFDTSQYKFGQAKLLAKKNKFYLHIAVEHDIPDTDVNKICNVVGIDRGLRFLASTYDSHGKSTFYSGRQIKNKKAKYRRLRRELQQVHSRSAKRRLKQISGRENRWMADVNHQISKALVESNPAGTLFAIEDLKGIRENVLLHVHNREARAERVGWSYLDLEEKLTYKALRKGSMVVKFNPAYTSQTCPVCGHVSKSNRDKCKHLFTCESCGYQSNDDRVAAMNLHRKGISWIAQDDCHAVSEE